MRTTQPAIQLSGVWKRYPSTEEPAVRDLHLTVYRGEILALLGPSGCGKTTTLRLIAGFERPDAGTVALNGQVVAGEGRFVPPERRGVGMVFQDYALFPHLTVAENIAFGLSSLPRAARRERVRELLRLTGLEDVPDRYPHQLSGGQQQRVAIARALGPNPQVLLLDEPFSNLDTELRLQMRAELRRLLEHLRITAVLVTHDQQEAMAIADRMAVMLAGHIEQIDTPEKVYHYPVNRAVAQFVGQATFVPARLNGVLAESDLGRFAFEPRASSPELVELLVRPRDVSLEADPQGIATVLSRQFQGSETVYLVQLPCGVQLQTSQPSYVDIPPGTRVRVRCNRARLAAFDRHAQIGVTAPPGSDSRPKRSGPVDENSSGHHAPSDNPEASTRATSR
ncbi:Fe(3+) ions import ATP-binding protein FbpC 2 [bacterium HR26]|nr:Fe(3+) ions import ATP-binding protein FbpC 2 [bacterium HR26]